MSPVCHRIALDLFVGPVECALIREEADHEGELAVEGESRFSGGVVDDRAGLQYLCIIGLAAEYVDCIGFFRRGALFPFLKAYLLVLQFEIHVWELPKGVRFAERCVQ